MPFVEVIWKPDRLSVDALGAICAELPGIVAESFTLHDPDPAHVVTALMVDLRVIPIGPHDRINPAMYITVLARTEPARDAKKMAIVGEIAAGIRPLGSPDDTLVELVLTNRVSLYEYRGG